jgi:hypothetical protein
VDGTLTQVKSEGTITQINCALECAIRKVKENQVGLKLNRTHQLLVYADDVNLLGDNINNMKKNTETLIETSKEVGREVNTETTKLCCYLFTRMQSKIMTF